MSHAIILYATRYGSTREIAEALATKLELPYKNVSEISDGSELENYDYLILGAPVYFDDIFEDMKHFITSFFIKIGQKKLITFAVYGAVKGHIDKDYAKTFAEYFQPNPILSLDFIGRATKSSLGEEDYKKLEIFYKNRLDAELNDFDYFDENKIDEAAVKIKEALI
ncbi:MAG: flavodoxin domain-containing protein [Thermoplasmata archaeon]|nr:flavodoxin domain-containing protein [Thermoplasmata archaeon]